MLWPHLGRLKAPVTLYAAVLLGMAWQASAQYAAVRHRPALFALVGAVLFVASDSILAVRRFSPASRLPRAAVLATYFAAQWLIALSALWCGMASADELIMARVAQPFPEGMNSLQQTIRDHGYVVSGVQRVDVGLTATILPESWQQFAANSAFELSP